MLANLVEDLRTARASGSCGSGGAAAAAALAQHTSSSSLKLSVICSNEFVSSSACSCISALKPLASTLTFFADASDEEPATARRASRASRMFAARVACAYAWLAALFLRAAT